MSGLRILLVGAPDPVPGSALAVRHQMVAEAMGRLGSVELVTPHQLEHRPDLREWVRRRTGRHGWDLVWASGQRAFEAAAGLGRVPIILDLAPDRVGADGSEPEGSRFDPRVAWRRRVHSVRAEILRKRAAARAGRAAAVVVASPAAWSPPGFALTIPYSYPTPPRPFGRRRPHVPPVVAAVGPCRDAPAVQAMRWLVEEILPAATERVPRLRLHLLSDTDGTMASLGGQFGVTVSTETVDVAYEAVDVVVLVAGAAADPTPALAAFAHRIPVVAHPDAVADLEVTDGDHVLLAETAPGFASAIQHALDAHATRPHLTVAAHRLWDTTYRADVVADQVVDLARHLTGRTQDS